MSPFRSVGARLSLALALVVAIALGVVYVIVVPSLERNLAQAKLDQLVRAAESQAGRFPADQLERLPDYVDLAAESANARVVFFTPLNRQRTLLSVQEDSRGTGRSAAIADDPIAERAMQSREWERGFVTRGGERYAEVAFPTRKKDGVLLFSTPLDETLASVDQVEQRLLIAGAVALALALVLGYGGATAFARRIRRLERAAERIAGGRLDEPVTDGGADELGQLAEAFERMRGRLATLDHARREFVANASHELRTPIFSLSGFLELIANDEVDTETRSEFLGTMQEQITRLERLATNLLDLTRIDSGQLQLEPERLDLAALADTLAEEFGAIALAGNHALDVVAEPSLPEALGDELRVLQVGRALVENALRHTPAGTRVRIRVGQTGSSVALGVEDDGPGIPVEHAADVFERFYRVHGAVASGSGLGLAIARELAAAMDGSIELESRPGRTVFRLLLPVAAEARAAEPALP